MALGKVAVMTQNLKAWREAVSHQPAIEIVATADLSIPGQASPMCAPTAFFMVDG
jgi:hypothetical protein